VSPQHHQVHCTEKHHDHQKLFGYGCPHPQGQRPLTRGRLDTTSSPPADSDPWAEPVEVLEDPTVDVNPDQVVGFLQFHDITVPILTDERGRWVSLTSLCNGLGIDAQGQRENIGRKHWSRGHTGVTPVCFPGHARKYDHFFVHEKRVPMWLANIDTSRLRDDRVRARVEATQIEFADVLAEWVQTGQVKPKGLEPDTAVVVPVDRSGLSNRELAMMVIAEADRADAAEKKTVAFSGGLGMTLTDYHDTYFSQHVKNRAFFEHLYSKGYLIDQRRGGSQREDGSYRDGPLHRRPSASGRAWIYWHRAPDGKGVIRESPRVVPGKEIEFKDRLIRDGLEPNNEDGIGTELDVVS
jgi:hypothetical protein